MISTGAPSARRSSIALPKRLFAAATSAAFLGFSLFVQTDDNAPSTAACCFVRKVGLEYAAG